MNSWWIPIVLYMWPCSSNTLLIMSCDYTTIRTKKHICASSYNMNDAQDTLWSSKLFNRWNIISIMNLFLLSLTSFCWGVYSAINLCSIPASSQKLLNVLLAIIWSYSLNQVCTFILNYGFEFSNTSATSGFCLSKKIQHILVRSSIKTM